MSFLRVLQQKRAVLISQGTTVFDLAAAENRPLTAEEAANVDTIDAQIEALQPDIARAERQAARERNMGVIADPNGGGARPGASGNGGGAGGFASFGEQLQAVARSSAMGAKIDPRLIEAAGAGMSEGVPSDGGFLVQPEYAQDLWMKAYQEGEIIKRCKKIPLSASTNTMRINAVKENSRANGSRWGGVLAYWADEGVTQAASRPQFRQIELNLKKLIGIGYATNELLSDAVALGSVMQDAFSQEMVFKTEDAIVNGDGVGKPMGIMNGGSMVTQAIEATQTIANSNQFLTFNVNKMWSRLFAPSMTSAVTAWFVNQDILPYLNTMTLGGTAAAMPVFMPPGAMSGSPYATLNGRPIIPIEQVKAIGTPGDFLLADFSQYLLTDRAQGVQAASSIHVRFLTDEMTYRFTFRVDGSPAWNQPLTPFSGGNTQSPFINLATRS